MADTVPDLDAIRARVEAATPGPWRTDYASAPFVEEFAGIFQPKREHYIVLGDDDDHDFTVVPADAEFIAHAREDVPALLAEVERLRAQRGAVLALHGTSAHWCASVSAGEHHQEFFVPGSTSWPCATATALESDSTP